MRKIENEEDRKVPVCFRIDPKKIENLKKIARRRANEEDRDISYIKIIEEGINLMEKKYEKYLK